MRKVIFTKQLGRGQKLVAIMQEFNVLVCVSNTQETKLDKLVEVDREIKNDSVNISWPSSNSNSTISDAANMLFALELARKISSAIHTNMDLNTLFN